MTEVKNLLLELLRFDTQNSDEIGEDALFRGETIDLMKFLESRLKKIGAKTILQEYNIESKKENENYMLNKRANLIAFPNDNLDLPFIALQGHLDTVPIGSFEGNPFGEIRKDVILGRGSSDMKGSVAAMIVAFEKTISNPKRFFNPILILTSDEEARGFAGIKKFIGDNKFKIEFAICGEPSNFRIYNQFKGATSRLIKVYGKSAHGSRPNLGINSIYNSIEILSLLKDFSKFIGENITNSDFISADSESHKSTLNLGRIVGGNKVNSVPERCMIEFEMRLVKNIEFYESELEKRVFDKISKEVDYAVEETFTYNPLVIDKNDVFTNRLCNIVKKEVNLDNNFGVMTEFSEATLLNLNNIKTVVFGPGDPNLSHSKHENISVNKLESYEKILVNLFCYPN